MDGPSAAPSDQSADHRESATRPLSDLTIRDLIVELDRLDDEQARQAGTADSERSRARRERLILAELRRRRSTEPAPNLTTGSSTSTDADVITGRRDGSP